MKRNYVKSVVDLLSGGADIASVLLGLKATLIRRGHQKLYPEVLSGTLRRYQIQENAKVPHLKVVSDLSLSGLKDELANALKELGAEGNPVVTVDKTISGGFILKHNHTMIDKSYKRKLQELYTSITNI